MVKQNLRSWSVDFAGCHVMANERIVNTKNPNNRNQRTALIYIDLPRCRRPKRWRSIRLSTRAESEKNGTRRDAVILRRHIHHCADNSADNRWQICRSFGTSGKRATKIHTRRITSIRTKRRDDDCPSFLAQNCADMRTAIKTYWYVLTRDSKSSQTTHTDLRRFAKILYESGRIYLRTLKIQISWRQNIGTSKFLQPIITFRLQPVFFWCIQLDRSVCTKMMRF